MFIIYPIILLSFLIGACVKSALRRYQLKPDADLLDDAHKIVEWCTKYMTLSSPSTWASRQKDSNPIFCFFWEISNVDRTRQFTCRIVQ